MLSVYDIQVQFCEHKRARCGIPPWIASVRAPLENPHDEHDNKNTPDHMPDFEKDKAYPDPTVASLEKLAEPCAKRRRCRVVDPDSVDLEQAAVVDPERGREEAIDPGQVVEQQAENIRSCWAAYRASTEKPRGKAWDAECQRQKRAQLRETEEGKQKLKKHSGTPPSKEVRLKSKVKCDFLKHVAQCEAWRNRFGDLPWSGVGPVGRGDVPGLESQLGFWVDRMRANAGKLQPECASRWVLLCGGQAHLLLEDGSNDSQVQEQDSGGLDSG